MSTINFITKDFLETQDKQIFCELTANKNKEDIPFWECLNTALSEFLDKYDELYGAKEIVYWGRRGSAGWMVEHFAYHNSGYDMLLSKEDLEKFITDLDAVHNEDDCSHVFPCASIDDVYFSRDKCKEILNTFDWENNDLIFYANW